MQCHPMCQSVAESLRIDSELMMTTLPVDSILSGTETEADNELRENLSGGKHTVVEYGFEGDDRCRVC